MVEFKIDTGSITLSMIICGCPAVIVMISFFLFAMTGEWGNYSVMTMETLSETNCRLHHFDKSIWINKEIYLNQFSIVVNPDDVYSYSLFIPNGINDVNNTQNPMQNTWNDIETFTNPQQQFYILMYIEDKYDVIDCWDKAILENNLFLNETSNYNYVSIASEFKLFTNRNSLFGAFDVWLYISILLLPIAALFVSVLYDGHDILLSLTSQFSLFLFFFMFSIFTYLTIPIYIADHWKGGENGHEMLYFIIGIGENAQLFGNIWIRTYISCGIWYYVMCVIPLLLFGIRSGIFQICGGSWSEQEFRDTVLLWTVLYYKYIARIIVLILSIIFVIEFCEVIVNEKHILLRNTGLFIWSIIISVFLLMYGCLSFVFFYKQCHAFWNGLNKSTETEIEMNENVNHNKDTNHSTI